MFLKALQLRGFKTFADAVEIEFGPDSRITAIVGPNGCGKSNLLDAARWALGEDNPRELRVAALEHIIFAGTAERKALSMAEVTLLFDNSAGKMPLPYSEIAVKRRTFREGQSEFFINKNLCRLKDIHELLLDTGLGEGNYSIITQGRVDSILSSKGEERRAVFEEAAGINKYQVRKQSAEKKLIAAEQNILRINDLKIEVSEQLITLEDQARKAREYNEVQTRVKEIELGLAKKLFGNLLEKKSKLLAELDTARQESAARQAAEQAAVDELAGLKTRLRGLELSIEEQAVKLDAAKDRLRDLEISRRFSQSELEREQRRKTELEQRRQELAAKIAALKQAPAAELPAAPPAIAEAILRITDQANQLFSAFAAIFSFFDSKPPFTLAGPAELQESRRLKAELLQEETRRLDGELQNVDFGLQAYQRELEQIPADGETDKAGLLEMINSLKNEKEAVSGKIIELEGKISGGRVNAPSTTALEIGLAKLDGEMNGLTEKISLEYNLSVAELETHTFEISNLARARAEVDAGRGRLRALEPVNLLAVEEYDRAKERLAFIDAQLTDLNSAHENLRRLISELDARAEETFAATMQQVSQVFSETFASLFTGGEAKISLSPGPTALEAEVEISVRPPGRKWLPLTLLSGGERALSAIAILFSLLKIRPSPFCFLDEVDAALDEANIGRFTRLLKDFSVHSQILVITHNKNTMAAADNIYGVTMQEAGVSKIISMKLQAVAA